MLVTNPIYDGPVYESVFPHFETVTANTQQNNIEPPETESSDHTFSAPSTPDTTQSNSARYVDNPLQLSDHCIDSPSTVTATESEQFTSVVSDNQKAMFTSNHSETQVTINYAAASEETYTVMNPAGTLTLSL